jgi:ADP-heptose:LPS heptosyltransferase
VRRALAIFVRVGDTVMMTPLLRHLARGVDLVVIARPAAADLLRHQPWIAEVHGLDKPRAYRGAGVRPLVARLRGRIDEVVGFASEGPPVQRLLQRIAPVRQLVLPFAGAGHVTDRIPAALAGAGFDLDGFDPTPRLDVAPAQREAAHADLARLGRRVLAIQAGSSLTDRAFWYPRRLNLKGLDPRQWAALLTGILRHDEADAVVFHGSARERDLAEAITALVPAGLRPRLHDRAGVVPLADLVAQLAAAFALISVDTGPAHIAAAVGCPLLSIFGPTDPTQYLPRGSAPVELLLGSAPCQFCHNTRLWDTCRDNICLNRLSPETLDAAWQRLRAKLPP